MGASHWFGVHLPILRTKRKTKERRTKKMKTETLITTLLVAAVAVLVAYFVYVAIQNFNLDLFLKSLTL